MPSLSLSLYAAALLCLAGAAPAASDTPVVAHAADQVQSEPAHAVPEPEVPFQVIAFAGLLLIWRNRRRMVTG